MDSHCHASLMRFLEKRLERPRRELRFVASQIV